MYAYEIRVDGYAIRLEAPSLADLLALIAAYRGRS